MIKISILIPIYNVEKYLRQCLDSVVNQTLTNIEIICIDDGSTDNSPRIIDEYAEKDNRIKVIHKKNTGYGHSMNQGLKLAQGEYIGIVESDDFAELNTFASLYDVAKREGAEIVRSNFFRQFAGQAMFHNNIYVPNDKIFSPIENYQIFSGSIAIWSAIYQRKFLIKNNIYFNETPGASYQDVSFFFKTLACAEKVSSVKEAFLHYRIDNPNSSVKSKEKVYYIFDEIAEIERFLSTRKSSQKYYNILESFKYGTYMFNYNRVDTKFKFDFLKRVAEEFERDDAAGYLDKTYWKEKNWQSVQQLINNRKAFFYKQFEVTQTKNTCWNGLFSIIDKYKNIYIYGAGNIAISLIRKLHQKPYNISGLIVSDMKNNPGNIMDIPVRTFDDNIIDRENDIILIAMKEEYQYDILYKLQEDGYKNIIIITEALNKTLR